MKMNFARRRVIAALASGSAWLAAWVTTASRASDEPGATDPFPQLAHVITGGAPIHAGRVRIDTPRLADNGHSVPITVRVESAMSAQEHVRRITLVSESNPRPLIATFHFTPKSGRAEISTRIRLNKSQRVMALAELSDGSFWADRAEVVVTESACLDAD